MARIAATKSVVSPAPRRSIKPALDREPVARLDLETVYEFDESATRIDVLFDTGDEAFVRIPVELPQSP